jgi:hypothetical protein
MMLIVLFGAGCDSVNNEQGTVNGDPVVIAIEEVFVDNYPEHASSVVVSISKTEGDLVKGNVALSQGMPHIFYAAKVEGDWDVIYDPEQKPYDCETLKGYEFSEKMIKGCKELDVEFTVADAQTIQKMLADKHGKTIEEVVAKVDKYDADHARGSVQFVGEQGGGIFLAAKEDGSWKIVVDGNGAYECSFIAQYGFPDEMVSDCY